MEEAVMKPIMAYFPVIPDPGKETSRKYPLQEVIAITIPALLEMITLEGCIATIDAMGMIESTSISKSVPSRKSAIPLPG